MGTTANGNVNISAPITVDSASPMLGYYAATNGSWAFDHSADPSTSSYFDSTFGSSTTEGDWLSLAFQGTGVTAFGALRPNHGNFFAFVDQQTSTNQFFGDGPADGTSNEFQANIFQTTVAAGAHTLFMINQPQAKAASQGSPAYFDVDYFIIDTGVVGKIYTTQFSSASNAWSFSADNWSKNGTEQRCTANGCAASLTFDGSALAVYGSLDTDHGNYTVQVDDAVNTISLKGTYPSLVNDSLLFLVQGLSEDQSHTVTLHNIMDGMALSLDYAIVNSTHAQPGANATGTTFATSMGGSSTVGNTTPSPEATKQAHSNTGAIAGGVVGGVVGAALIAGLIWFFLHKRKHSNTNKTRYGSLDLNGEPNYPLDGGEVQPFQAGGSREPAGTSAGHLTSPSMSQSGRTGTTFLSSVPPPPGSNATSYPGSPTVHTNSSSGYGPLALGSNNSASNLPGSQSVSGSSSSDASRPILGAGMLTPQNALAESGGGRHKTAYTPLPYTAQQAQSSADVSSRYAVEGREVDMGPAGETGMLPPDYSQATQPLPGQRPGRSP